MTDLSELNVVQLKKLIKLRELVSKGTTKADLIASIKANVKKVKRVDVPDPDENSFDPSLDYKLSQLRDLALKLRLSPGGTIAALKVKIGEEIERLRKVKEPVKKVKRVKKTSRINEEPVETVEPVKKMSIIEEPVKKVKRVKKTSTESGQWPDSAATRARPSRITEEPVEKVKKVKRVKKLSTEEPVKRIESPSIKESKVFDKTSDIDLIWIYSLNGGQYDPKDEKWRFKTAQLF